MGGVRGLPPHGIGGGGGEGGEGGQGVQHDGGGLDQAQAVRCLATAKAAGQICLSKEYF